MPIRQTISRFRRFFLLRVLHADDNPHRLALGIAIGIFTAWLPLMGTQMVLVVLLATLFRANKVVGLPFVWISNPLTLAPIYYPAFVLGNQIVGLFGQTPTLDYVELKALLMQVADVSYIFAHLFDRSFWLNVGGLFVKIGLEVFIGGFIIGIILAVVTYVIIRRVIIWYRTETSLGKLHAARMQRREARRRGKQHDG